MKYKCSKCFFQSNFKEYIEQHVQKCSENSIIIEQELKKKRKKNISYTVNNITTENNVITLRLLNCKDEQIELESIKIRTSLTTSFKIPKNYTIYVESDTGKRILVFDGEKDGINNIKSIICLEI